MFNNIYTDGYSVGLIFLTLALALVGGVISSFLSSFKLRSSKGFFTTVAILPTVVAATFTFLNVVIYADTSSAVTGIAAVMLGMGLIRFRSAQGSAEEMLILFLSVAIGIVAGLGYAAYSIILSVVLPVIYVALSSANFLKSKLKSGEKILKITIPEDLQYTEVFDEIFKKYLKEYEGVGVKTTGMGSMFRLSYRIVMKNVCEEKNMIDEIRTKNGNLEVSVLPFADGNVGL